MFAVKVTSLDKMTDLDNLMDIRNELVLQKVCNNSNIMRVYSCFNWQGNLWVAVNSGFEVDCDGVHGKWMSCESCGSRR